MFQKVAFLLYPLYRDNKRQDGKIRHSFRIKNIYQRLSEFWQLITSTRKEIQDPDDVYIKRTSDNGHCVTRLI